MKLSLKIFRSLLVLRMPSHLSNYNLVTVVEIKKPFANICKGRCLCKRQLTLTLQGSIKISFFKVLSVAFQVHGMGSWPVYKRKRVLKQPDLLYSVPPLRRSSQNHRPLQREWNLQYWFFFVWRSCFHCW